MFRILIDVISCVYIAHQFANMLLKNFNYVYLKGKKWSHSLFEPSLKKKNYSNLRPSITERPKLGAYIFSYVHITHFTAILNKHHFSPTQHLKINY